jgi:hypothetical protein
MTLWHEDYTVRCGKMIEKCRNISPGGGVVTLEQSKQ